MAIVVALGCVVLGRWQWDRYQDKRDRKQLVERNYGSPVAPLDDLLPDPRGRFDPTLQWRPVRAVGSYLPDATVLVRNRPRDVGGAAPTFGYEVVVPLRLDDGNVLLVDRGWVASGTQGRNPAAEPDVVPPPPPGRVEVVASLRASEPRRDQQLPAGQAGSVSIPQIAASLGVPVYPAYAALRTESPAASPAPVPVPRPELDGGEGINASYAVQWGVFGLLALGFPFWFVRRTRAAAADDDRASRRRRIWDDEDE